MEAFKFLNRKQRKIMWAIVLVSSSTTLTALLIFLTTNMNLFFLSFLISIIPAVMLLSKAKNDIEEIITDSGLLKLYFFNPQKTALKMERDKIKTVIEEKRIVIKSRDSGKLLGIAEKDSLEEQDKWPRLVELLRS